MVIEADAIKNRDVMLKHLSSSDFTKNDPTLSSYVHEYSTKAAEAMLVAAGELVLSCPVREACIFHVRHGRRNKMKYTCIMTSRPGAWLVLLDQSTGGPSRRPGIAFGTKDSTTISLLDIMCSWHDVTVRRKMECPCVSCVSVVMLLWDSEQAEGHRV